MRETGRSGVAAYLTKRIKELGGYRRKVRFEGHNGCPDQLCCLKKPIALKKPFFVETKCKTGRLEDHQRREHERLRKIGFKVFVPRCKAEVDELLDTGSCFQG